MKCKRIWDVSTSWTDRCWGPINHGFLGAGGSGLPAGPCQVTSSLGDEDRGEPWGMLGAVVPCLWSNDLVRIFFPSHFWWNCQGKCDRLSSKSVVFFNLESLSKAQKFWGLFSISCDWCMWQTWRIVSPLLCFFGKAKLRVVSLGMQLTFWH